MRAILYKTKLSSQVNVREENTSTEIQSSFVADLAWTHRIRIIQIEKAIYRCSDQTLTQSKVNSRSELLSKLLGLFQRGNRKDQGLFQPSLQYLHGQKCPRVSGLVFSGFTTFIALSLFSVQLLPAQQCFAIGVLQKIMGTSLHLFSWQCSRMRLFAHFLPPKLGSLLETALGFCRELSQNSSVI